MRSREDRASFPDDVGTHFSAHSSRLGLYSAPHGALLDGIRESVRIRGNGARVLQASANRAQLTASESSRPFLTRKIKD